MPHTKTHMLDLPDIYSTLYLHSHVGDCSLEYLHILTLQTTTNPTHHPLNPQKNQTKWPNQPNLPNPTPSIPLEIRVKLKPTGPHHFWRRLTTVFLRTTVLVGRKICRGFSGNFREASSVSSQRPEELVVGGKNPWLGRKHMIYNRISDGIMVDIADKYIDKDHNEGISRVIITKQGSSTLLPGSSGSASGHFSAVRATAKKTESTSWRLVKTISWQKWGMVEVVNGFVGDEIDWNLRMGLVGLLGFCGLGSFCEFCCSWGGGWGWLGLTVLVGVGWGWKWVFWGIGWVRGSFAWCLATLGFFRLVLWLALVA